MSDRPGEDEAFSADMLLIEELAEGLGLSQWPGDAETIVEIGDLENTSLLAGARQRARRRTDWASAELARW
jgi:hypothetical protein